MSALPIPPGPEALTSDWLTAALGEGGVVEKASVADFEAEPVGEEFGFTGRLARVTLKYDQKEEGAPGSLVAKFPNPSARLAQDPARSARLHERFRREVLFYQRFGCDAGIRTPCPYFGAADRDGGAFVLLLEDLTPCRVGDAMVDSRLADARLLVDAVARFHARWWQRPELLELGWLPQWGWNAVDAQARLGNSRGPFLEQFGKWLPEAVSGLVDKLLPVYGRLLEELGRSPWTMVHNDLHGDNLLFDAPGAPIAVVDWQGVGRGRAAVDLIQTVVARPDPAERQELLQQYQRKLVESGVDGYSFDQLQRDCRLALLQNLGGVVNGYAGFDSAAAGEREREMVEAFFRRGRLFAALVEWEVGEVIGELRRP